MFGNSGSVTNYTLAKMSYTSEGDLGSSSKVTGRISSGEIKKVTIEHKSVVEPNVAGITIQKAFYFDSAKRDKTYIKGKVDLGGVKISQIIKSLSIKLGSLSFEVNPKKIKKIKVGSHIHFAYVDWSKKGIVFELNGSTGDFSLYIPNASPIKVNVPSSTTLRLEIDGFNAEGAVQFKDIKGTKNGHKKHHSSCKLKHKHSFGRR